MGQKSLKNSQKTGIFEIFFQKLLIGERQDILHRKLGGFIIWKQNFGTKLNEPVYNFDLDPSETTWFIKNDGQILANNSSHKQLLKDNFPEDWEIFTGGLSQTENKDKTDPLIEAEAERVLTIK